MEKSYARIRLDSSQYFPGNTITGEAMFYFRSPKEFRKIRIRLRCHEHTHWTKTHRHHNSGTRRNQTVTHHYNGDNDILLLDNYILDQGSLPSGTHVFPIRFQLPLNIPSSFVGEWGYIKYSIKITVDLPMRFDIEDTMVFNVIAPIIMPIFLMPTTISGERSICCCFCREGTIQLQVSLNRTTFVVGETENIRIYCSNLTNVQITSVEVKLKQKLLYNTTQPCDSRFTSKIINTLQNAGVGANGENTYHVAFQVPNIMIPNFASCMLFRSFYTLKVVAYISGCHQKLEAICHVNVIHQNTQNEPVCSQPMPSSLPSISIPSDNLPSYEEATGNSEKHLQM
ncbi:hypothetical protein ABEB36_011481 [Hypothenemus hampei]|uniref:Arrestin C-terminal-like domain-containing protein n=1 Tax=Hypothenemus hampei TaxID=57062 RepID=A0ABD1EFJ9_HYPHA